MVDCLVTYLFHDLCPKSEFARTAAVGQCWMLIAFGWWLGQS